MSLFAWSWMFLIVYIVGMLAFGWIASRRISNADDFATARSSYGPYFLALAFAATTASGATFLGSPGLGYQFGMASVWGKFLYPMGVYFGVLITIKLVANSGHKFGNRSIPEYLGRPLPERRRAVARLRLLAGPVLLHRRAARVGAGHVRDHARTQADDRADHHVRRAARLCGARRRPRGHPHRRHSGDDDARRRDRRHRHVPLRLRDGRRPGRARLQPARPGRAPGRAGQHVEFALRLLVGPSPACCSPTSRSACCPTSATRCGHSGTTATGCASSSSPSPSA